jgi:hypothetical protein
LAKASAATQRPAPVRWPGAALGFGDGLDELALGADGLAYRAFAAVAAANATAVRFPLRWDRVEIRPGTLDWSSYEPLHRQLVWHGLTALPVIVGAPSWLGAEQTKRSPGGLAYPVGNRGLNALGDFIVATIRYFTSIDDCIEAVEIWEEPNSRSGTGIANPAEFLRMVSTAAMHVGVENRMGAYVRPKTAVAGGLAMGPGAKPWVDYLRGAHPDYFPHAVAVHSYPGPASSGESASAYADRASTQVSQAVEQVSDATDSEVWVTATGATSHGPWGEDGQAQALGSLTAALAGIGGCRGMVISPLLAGLSAQAGQDPDASLLTAEGRPKPALAEVGAAWAGAG